MSAQDLARDPDLLAETQGLSLSQPVGTQSLSGQASPAARVPLSMDGGSHRATPATKALLEEIGGLEAIQKMTEKFYPKVFRDAHIDQFVRSHDDPHGRRLALWIVEKMGGGAVWTQDRRERSKEPVKVAGGRSMVVHDRTSAHVAAWNSPKRKAHDVGNHFDLKDSRIWMRLMFWSAREAGLLENARFADWYIRFIGHFVRVYERLAPPFARESARWSANPQNIKDYEANGYRMTDILDSGTSTAYDQLPEDEANDPYWPYEA